MDVREKLVGLANDVLLYLPWGEIQKDTAERIADRMMDHGVTVQEWISVKDRLPEEPGIYQIFGYDKDWKRTKVWYGQFSGYDWFVYDIYGNGKRFEVTHWMPLPQPPKGE